MEKIELNNYITVPVRQKSKIFFKYLFIVCGIMLIFFTGIMWLGGEKTVSTVVTSFICIIQGLRMNGSTERTIEIPLEICFEKNKVTLIYPCIDKNDGKGSHKETYIYQAEDVGVLQENKMENAMRLEGLSLFMAEYANGSSEILDGRKEQKAYNFVIYFVDEVTRKKIIDGMQKSLSRVIQQV